MSTSINHFQYSRSSRLLLYNPHSMPASGPAAPGPSAKSVPGSRFDADVVVILAVLLCALSCALGVSSIVRCALRCSSRFVFGFGFEHGPDWAARVAGVGAHRKALRALPITVYSAGLKLTGSGSECAICLSDLVPGERIRVLPGCGHRFHVGCIDRWLMTGRPLCPRCRKCLFTTTSHKSSGCGEVNPIDPVRSIIVPIEPEGIIYNYRGGS